MQQDFVCDEALKTSHIQLAFYFGVLVGDLGFGLLADMYVPAGLRQNIHNA